MRLKILRSERQVWSESVWYHDCLIDETLQLCAQKYGIQLMCIQPGKPQQNAYIERYNRTARQVWLGQYHFDTLDSIREYIRSLALAYSHAGLRLPEYHVRLQHSPLF